MNRFFLSILIAATILLSSCTSTSTHSDKEAAINEKVDSLLNNMSLEEKVGQMLNLGLPALLTGPFYSGRDTLVFDTNKVNENLINYLAGSVQNLGNYPLSPKEWEHYIGELQRIVKQKTRLGIPILYGIDAVHGANYTAGSVMFPHQINLAAAFNREITKTVGEITAYEMRASSIPWNYSPVLDVARHPMWGRIYESFGEDTYLVSEMGKAMIHGMQGDDPSAKTKVVACAKHFIGYGASYNGKDRAPIVMSENYIRQILLPPFKEAIDNGLLSIMISSGTLNGTPSHADNWLITDLLKTELGFKGVVISDWNDIDNLVSVHQVAMDEREAVKLAVLAGIDICMEPYDASFAKHLIDLVKDGEIPLSRINDAVRRVLYLKYKTGIMENPLMNHKEYPKFSSSTSDSMNYNAACESITLLKNEDAILPLSKNTKILVTGVAANSINYLNGGWSRTWSGQETAYNDVEKLTIYQAIKHINGEGNTFFAEGTGYTTGDYIAKAVAQARKVDVIIACVGEQPATEKPSDINELVLPEIQQELIKALAKLGKPIVMVMAQGRPRIIREIEPLTKGIVMAFLPGNEGGRAIADILYGKVNPSGKLPYTYPRYCGSLWTYNHLRSDERDVNFGLNGFTPQYEFGDGLSYTTFSYANFQLNNDTISTTDTLRMQVTITNTGGKKGKETTMLFLSDEVASVSPAVKQLKRFQKIELMPDESNTVEFELTINDLQFVNRENKWVSEPGFFTLAIGTESARFYLKD